MKTGIELIADERKEQIEKHGRTIEHDVRENADKQLRDAATALINKDYHALPNSWKFALCSKMMDKLYYERLIIAGALIAAEIDRLQVNT